MSWYKGQGVNHIFLKNSIKRKTIDTMTTYIIQTFKLKKDNKVISVTNLSPRLSFDQKQAVKYQIEQNLYDVFIKYVSSKF